MDSPENFSDSDGNLALKRNIGISLIALGVALAAWIFSIGYRLIHGGLEIALISRIFLDRGLDRFVTTPSGEFEIPDIAILFFGYIITIMFLGMLASLSKGLIQTGTQLIQPGYKELLRKIKGGISDHLNRSLSRK